MASNSNEHELPLATHDCSLSLYEHVEMTMTALTLFGVGLGCETQYHALLVLAEIARRLHGHALGFDPNAQAEEIMKQAYEAHARALNNALGSQQPETHAAPSAEAIEVPGTKQVH